MHCQGRYQMILTCNNASFPNVSFKGNINGHVKAREAPRTWDGTSWGGAIRPRQCLWNLACLLNKKTKHNCGLAFLLNKRIALLAVAHPQYLLLVTLADGEVVYAQGPSRSLRQRQLLNTCVSSDSFSKHLLPNHIAHSKRDVIGT